MGRPAARIGDMHICPMVTPGLPPIPHVGGPILPLGVPTVLIGGQPAAVQTNMCTCIGPPDSIIMGSLGVYIGGLSAARILDKTIHGGQVSFGLGTVLIGDINMAAAAAIFPGQQSFGNCGIQSSEQLIHQATGTAIAENTILQVALNNSWAQNSTINSQRGGTGATSRQSILNNYGVGSQIQTTTPQNISNALVDRRGVVANVEAGVLWGRRRRLGGHAITIVDGDWDDNGDLTHVYINDTGNGNQYQRVPINTFTNAANAHPNSQLNVTDDPIMNTIR